MHDSIPSNAPIAAGAPQAQSAEPRPAFEEPRLVFIEPRLTPRGDLREVTAGAFGDFSP